LAPAKKQILQIAGREVTLSNPDKIYFPKAGYTKKDLADYYLAVAEGALRGAGGRPMALKRYVNGAEGEFFFQKRAPDTRPEWIETVQLAFPSGRTADEIVLRDAAQLLWIVNLGCIDLNPHPVRADDLDHPDELRVDLDPVPGIGWEQIRQVALVTREALEAVGLRGWPKTSGSRGIHINVRIERKWSFDQVRRAALAIARDVEKRAPQLATSKWWKEERHGVFLDYNQNAKDRTVASAYSVRPTADARVSMPLGWDEIAICNPADFTIKTVPPIFQKRGDAATGIDEAAGDLTALLELSDRHEKDGLGDAPWPPHYPKQDGEPPRVMPSRRKVTQPLIEIARAAKKEEAEAGLQRWKDKHPDAAKHLQPADVLVDAMRGKYTTWTRIRINLKNVPENERPPQEALECDYDPWHGETPPKKPPRKKLAT
jgi:DNA ligase D-like protein (predicted polymerase)